MDLCSSSTSPAAGWSISIVPNSLPWLRRLVSCSTLQTNVFGSRQSSSHRQWKLDSFLSISHISLRLKKRKMHCQNTYVAAKSSNTEESSHTVPHRPKTLRNKLFWLFGISALGSIIFLVATRIYNVGSNNSSITAITHTAERFNISFWGHNISLGEHTPGWVYFLLLMAAGFGLFVSEEALNVWVGASIARCLIWNGGKEKLLMSIRDNAPYIASTLLWVYWGVCISDMIPFYAGRIASETKAVDSVRRKLRIPEKKLELVKRSVQQYGNLIGFVERFSIGVRNPTSFLAGVAGIAPAKYFAGVCLGCLMTLPLQLAVGCAMRERPVAALAGVAAFVGAWTVLPYVAAGLASIMYFRTKS